MIKIGIIGTGYWGKHHLRVFSRLPCELIGISDIDPAKEKLAGKYRVKFFTDYKKLLPKVDAVIIVTPPSSHYKISRTCLKKGKHVFIEKPFVKNRKKGIELIDLARKVKKHIMIGHIYQYHPAVKDLKRLIDSCALGKIYYLLFQRLNLGIVRQDVNALWNFAPHDLSILLYLLDEKPHEISCHGESYLREGIEDISTLSLKFKNKVMAHIIVSWLHPAKVRELTVVGSKKMAIFDDVETKAPLKIYDKGVDVQLLNSQREWGTYGEFKMKTRFGDIVTPSLKSAEPLEAEGSHFLDCIRSGKSPLSDGKNGMDVLNILEAATKSMKKGGRSIEIKYDY